MKCSAHAGPGRAPKYCAACQSLKQAQPVQVQPKPAQNNRRTVSSETTIEEEAAALQRRVQAILARRPTDPAQTSSNSPTDFRQASGTDNQPKKKCPKHTGPGRAPKDCEACQALKAARGAQTVSPARGAQPNSRQPELVFNPKPDGSEARPKAVQTKADQPVRRRLRLEVTHGQYTFPILGMLKRGFDLRHPYTTEEMAALRSAWAEEKRQRNVEHLGMELQSQVQISVLMPMRYPEAEAAEAV